MPDDTPDTADAKAVAEVISIGDELTSGQRLDTNSQWLSQQLGEMGLRTVRHTTVCDDTEAMLETIQAAVRRSNIVLMTGGLGPTSDDLTRQVIADAAGVELEHHSESETHIRKLFETRGREMPLINLIQAKFPKGASVIPNRTGTAPGIDFPFESAHMSSRLFAFPGVPAELKLMWREYARPAILEFLPDMGLIMHHTIHCFGLAESDIETRMPGIIDRDRIPVVGITASSATITLRITAKGRSPEECYALIQPTAEMIRTEFCESVFGENDITLPEVVVGILSQQKKTLAIVDAGACGLIADMMQSADPEGATYRGTISLPADNTETAESNEASNTRQKWVDQARSSLQADLLLYIGGTFQESGVMHRDVWIANETDSISQRLVAASNPSIIVPRSIKQALNFLRLALRDERR